MKRNFRTISGILVALTMIFVNVLSGFAEEVDSNGEEFVDSVRKELNLKKAEYRQILNTTSSTAHELEELGEKKLTLIEQLRNLDRIEEKAELRLNNARKQIVKAENEIDLINEEIETREIVLSEQKKLLADYLRVLYEEERKFLNVDEDGEIDAVKLLFSDGTVGENVKKLDYLEVLSEAGAQMIEKIETVTAELQQKKAELRDKKAELRDLRDQLELENENITLKKVAKENLIRVTEGQQKIYEKLQEQSEREQEEVLNDLKGLSEAVAYLEAEMERLGDKFDPADYEDLVDRKTRALYDFKIDLSNVAFDGFRWPVDPSARGISAYFRDPGYVGVFGVQHNAIDLPTPQGSAVRAAADGVVYTAKDNGLGYSYIIIAHADGFNTVYGHISEILVDEGDTIKAGAIIGLSGGMPGTKGAGYMTTGPHLHFEVLHNSQYVDPLDYLPLELLSEEQIERLPEKYFEKWLEAVE